MSRSSSADIHLSASVAESATIWELAQIRENAVISSEVVVGRGVYVGPGVIVGAMSKLQNFSQLHEPARLEVGVFIGPGVVLTNDRHPRSCRLDGGRKGASDWSAVGVSVLAHASVGANAVVVAPVTLGKFCMIAAGAVVVKDVPNYALMAGNPATQIGWVGRSGRRLKLVGDSMWSCPDTNEVYRLTGDQLSLIATSQ